MKKRIFRKRAISILLAVLMAFTGILPATAAFAGDGVEGYYHLELFYKDTDTIVPSTMPNPNNPEEEVNYIEYMHEGDELNLTYKLIDTAMPDNGYVKWYSETPALVDVTQEGVVKAFDSSKGAAIHTWIDNEVKTVPLVGNAMAKIIEKALFNEYVDLETMDTEGIIELVEAAFGTGSPLDEYFETYKGELIDSLRYYLDNINSNVHCQLFSENGTLLSDDFVQVNVLKSEEWYANFLPNGTHITNKSQINTTVAVGSEVQLYALTTPARLEYGCVYSVKSSSVFDQGKVVATVDDSGLVKFKNTGTVTIMVSPDSEQVIENILKLVNYFYEVNGELIDSHQLADILIKYIGIDMNRNVLAALLDTCFAIYDIASDVADPVQLTATAVKIIANLVLQFAYNDTITFTVVEAQPITDFRIEGVNPDDEEQMNTSVLSVKEGAQIRLRITDVVPSVGDVSDITWRSSDPAIASVDPITGVVTGRDAGGSLGALSSNTCRIYAVSAANNVERSVQITITGKTGKYLSDVEILGEQYLEMGMETDYTYQIYPKRVAENDNLYISWGILTGEDEDGNPVYAWADAENPVTDGRGQLEANGHYTVISGGTSTIALNAKTGYYLSNGNFYEISNITKTMDITNGIPVESITLNVAGVKGIVSSIVGTEVVKIGNEELTYVSVKPDTQYYGAGASLSAQVYPENASNQTLTWIVDNSNYDQTISDDTHTIDVRQHEWHEKADAVNVYAVSADGKVRSNVITICVSKNTVTENYITDKDKNQIESIDVINGQQADIYHDISFKKNNDGTYSACYKCNWYSSDEGIFSVTPKNNDNRDATITANDVGTATLYCISADGGKVDTIQVTVYPDKTYLKNIVELCDKTSIKKTKDNSTLYRQYSRKLDLAYTVLYDEPMASQTACDTYADELLIAFYKLGGFVGIAGVDIRAKGGESLASDHITVSVGSTSNYKNYSYDFDYKIAPKDAMYSKITWTSSNPNISVDANGVCKPTSNDPCAAIITCTVTDYMGTEISDSVFLSFARTKVTGISLNKTTIENGLINTTETLTATVTPKPVGVVGGASCTDVYWTSSNEEIATVDQKGVVTFHEGGTCMIIATTYDGGFVAQCLVNVVTNYTDLELLIQQYTDLQLSEANFYPDSWAVYTAAMAKAQKIVTERKSSQNEVDAMYAELKNAYDSLEKYTYINAVELYLDGEQTSEFYQYDLGLLTEGISYKNAILDLNVRLYPNNASYKNVVWSSSTSDIAVTSDGKASPTANKSCYGRITCVVWDHFGNSFEDSVWVSFAYVPVTSLGLSEESIYGPVDSTRRLVCTVYPTGDSLTHIGKASIQDYYWESDNEEIATVDQTGLVTFKKAGATVVRAVSYDGGISAECIVCTEGDRTALKKAVDAYKNVDYTEYEYDYGMAFKNAYEAAQKAMTDVTYSQEQIDEAANNLVNAYNALEAHPYIKSTDVTVEYTTYATPAVGSEKQKTSGTIGSTNALSVNLSSSDYSNWNDYNRVSLNAVASPSNAMYKSIAWNVDSSQDMKTSVSNNAISLVPKEKSSGAWAILTATITDHYDRTIQKTVYVTMSDKVCTGFDITDASKNIYVTASPTKINYTVSGSPEFTNIVWTSDNENVVKVNENGELVPVEMGSATVTGKTVDGGFTDKLTVTVQTDFRTLASKQSQYYDLIQQVKDGYTYTEESLNNLSVVVAEAQTMINDGKATQAEVEDMIVRLDNAYNALEYYIAVTGVKVGAVEDTNVTVVKDGYIHYIGTFINNTQVLLKPVFNDENAVYTELTWTSSNPNITVDENGILINNSASAGVTEVTCTVSNVFGATFTASAYVSFARNAVTGISFADEVVFGAPAQTLTLTPNITNAANATTSYVKECTYTTSDPSVATVDDNGVVTFLTQGTATITATTKDGGYSATIQAVTTWDTTALKAAIDEAEQITYTDYAYDYGTAFNEALVKAKEVYQNVYASQAEINSACVALTEAMNALDGHEFVVPEINLKQGDTVLKDNDLIQVDADTQKATVSLALNDGAMYRSADISVSEENGVTAVVNGTSVEITKSVDKGSLKVTATVIDDYGREYTKTYTLSVIDEPVPATAIAMTFDGVVVDGSFSKTDYAKNYRDFADIQLGYVTTPANANTITQVTYESSASLYIKVDENGVLTLTTAGKLRDSRTATITCTVTNADGTTASASVMVTLATI